MKYTFSYLVKIQFLGFRFHGWQKQQDVKTLHDMVDKSLSFVFKDKVYKTLGVGRTDALVSASSYYLQLFLEESINTDEFIRSFNENLPQDIRVLELRGIEIGHDLIGGAKRKEYRYYFSFGAKNHPFSAPFMTCIQSHLDIELMKEAARLFEGTHFFHKYCTKPSPTTNFKRTISTCKIESNSDFTASFFPKESFVLIVKGSGFLRYQIRLMMGVLFEIGKHNLTLDFIKDSLSESNDRKHLPQIAPASGLQLYDIQFLE